MIKTLRLTLLCPERAEKKKGKPLSSLNSPLLLRQYCEFKSQTSPSLQTRKKENSQHLPGQVKLRSFVRFSVFFICLQKGRKKKAFVNTSTYVRKEKKKKKLLSRKRQTTIAFLVIHTCTENQLVAGRRTIRKGGSRKKKSLNSFTIVFSFRIFQPNWDSVVVTRYQDTLLCYCKCTYQNNVKKTKVGD